MSQPHPRHILESILLIIVAIAIAVALCQVNAHVAPDLDQDQAPTFDAGPMPGDSDGLMPVALPQVHLVRWKLSRSSGNIVLTGHAYNDSRKTVFDVSAVVGFDDKTHKPLFGGYASVVYTLHPQATSGPFTIIRPDNRAVTGVHCDFNGAPPEATSSNQCLMYAPPGFKEMETLAKPSHRMRGKHRMARWRHER